MFCCLCHRIVSNVKINNQLKTHPTQAKAAKQSHTPSHPPIMSPAVADAVAVAGVAAAVAGVEQHPIKWHKMLTGNWEVGNGKCGNGNGLVAQPTGGIMPPIKLMISQNITGTAQIPSGTNKWERGILIVKKT